MRRRQSSIAKITRPDCVAVFQRKRLFHLLYESRKQPVTWITAPAGSGKTTLVASYITERKLPCLWYQVDTGDHDAATFFYYSWYRKAYPLGRGPQQFLH
jgi:ATP/maltotriose-dependent transcriptional regulator MalT